jgi:hypothetical protein
VVIALKDRVQFDYKKNGQMKFHEVDWDYASDEEEEEVSIIFHAWSLSKSLRNMLTNFAGYF